jgi:RNA-directed DNA polymerase
VDGERWETPEQKATAVARIGQWQHYRPRPLKRIAIPNKSGKQRRLSIPTLEDRARQAAYLQALQPIAETQADPNSYGFRPKRRCADAIDQCFKVLRQQTSATWILEGDIQGFFDHIAFSWIEEHTPMNKRILAKWLRCGFIDHGALYPTTAGVPQGGILTPPTMLRTASLRTQHERVSTDAKHYRYFLFVNLDPTHQGPNNLPLRLPIGRDEAPLHLSHEFL